MTNTTSVQDSDKNDDTEIVSNEEVDYDQLISAAGEFGLYQVFLTLLTFPFYVFGVFSYFVQLFITEPSPNHWCWIPELENLTILERRTLAIPLDENARFGYSQCLMYVANWSEVLSSGVQPNQSWTTQQCQSGWEFNKTEIPYPTITSELGWVCDKGSYQATAQSVFFVGSVAGGFFIGWLSDRFGRIPAVIASNMFGCVAGIISIFAQNIVQFSLCRFLMGMGYDSCMMMTYIIVLEFVAPKYRSLMANLPFAVFYSLAATSLPWIALACGHWKLISIATSVPMALALFSPCIVPESPRWLLSKDRVDEAVDKVISISRINKKEVPIKLIQQFKASVSKKEKAKSVSLLDLLARPLLRKIFICLCIEFMCCMLVFDALIRSLGGLEFDFFMSFTLVSLTEFPSLVLVSFILDYTGRKYLTILCMLVCSVFSVLTDFLSGGLASVLCAVVARFAINICMNVSIQWGAEVLPTTVRGSGISFVHICGYISTMLSPYVVYLQNYIIWLPLIIVAGIAVLGAASALVLPETTGKEMPHTFDDAEDMIRNSKLFDVPLCFKKRSTIKTGQDNSTFEMN